MDQHDRRAFMDTERWHAASRIARGYWCSADFVYDLLEFFGDNEHHTQMYLDLYSPLGRIPSAHLLRESFGKR